MCGTINLPKIFKLQHYSTFLSSPDGSIWALTFLHSPPTKPSLTTLPTIKNGYLQFEKHQRNTPSPSYSLESTLTQIRNHLWLLFISKSLIYHNPQKSQKSLIYIPQGIVKFKISCSSLGQDVSGKNLI